MMLPAAAAALLVILVTFFMAWAVRGKSSQIFGRTLWRGPSSRRALALTFDDGPGETTPVLLALLAEHQVKATFFLCGAQARRLPEAARAIRDAGHEIGNHTETHARLWLRRAAFIAGELTSAQQSIRAVLGVEPRLFRPTYGVRWFGLAAVEKNLGLTRVMWSGIGRDWRLDGPGVERRLKRATRPGAILLLHDAPGVTSTAEALRALLPWWRKQGYEIVKVSELLNL